MVVGSRSFGCVKVEDWVIRRDKGPVCAMGGWWVRRIQCVFAFREFFSDECGGDSLSLQNTVSGSVCGVAEDPVTLFGDTADNYWSTICMYLFFFCADFSKACVLSSREMFVCVMLRAMRAMGKKSKGKGGIP